jgi:hypothetical protein
LAWEVIPGKTPYTKDSEVQNAETSAWGRAIVAVGAATAKKIASREEVRNRTENVVAIDNAEGRTELRQLCEENGYPPEVIAALFKQRLGRDAKISSNEDLKAFVAMVRAGTIKIAN